MPGKIEHEHVVLVFDERGGQRNYIAALPFVPVAQNHDRGAAKSGEEPTVPGSLSRQGVLHLGDVSRQIFQRQRGLVADRVQHPVVEIAGDARAHHSQQEQQQQKKCERSSRRRGGIAQFFKNVH